MEWLCYNLFSPPPIGACPGLNYRRGLCLAKISCHMIYRLLFILTHWLNIKLVPKKSHFLSPIQQNAIPSLRNIKYNSSLVPVGVALKNIKLPPLLVPSLLYLTCAICWKDKTLLIFALLWRFIPLFCYSTAIMPPFGQCQIEQAEPTKECNTADGSYNAAGK